MAAISRASVVRVRVLPEAFEFALLQHAEKFGLQFQGNLADFIEEYCAAVSKLEATDALRDCAGKRPLFVAEQLALEQSHWDRGAIQFHERVRLA